eukprot:1628841-Amphidinium_carterae.1
MGGGTCTRAGDVTFSPRTVRHERCGAKIRQSPPNVDKVCQQSRVLVACVGRDARSALQGEIGATTHGS